MRSYDRYTMVSSKGRTSDFDSENVGSTPTTITNYAEVADMVMQVGRNGCNHGECRFESYPLHQRGGRTNVSHTQCRKTGQVA